MREGEIFGMSERVDKKKIEKFVLRFLLAPDQERARFTIPRIKGSNTF